jgi:hypothetical protein
MNDIAKKSVADRFLTAIKKENLVAKEAGAIVGILPAYISMMKNPKYWANCPAKAWDAVLAWVKSGYTLHGWKTKKPVKEVVEKVEKPVPPKEEEIYEPEFEETPIAKEKSKEDAIDDKSLVQIITFLKMKATEHRELADAFDKAANSFLNKN